MKNSKQHAMTVIAILVGGLFSQGALSAVNNPTSDVSNDDVTVNNASWNGNFTISNPNQGYSVKLSNAAQWNGNLNLVSNSGNSAFIELEGSSWSGVKTGMGINPYLQMTVRDGSAVAGPISWAGEGASMQLQLLNSSQFTGDVSLGGDTSTYVGGSIAVGGNSLYRGNLSSVAGENANATVNLYDASQWYGDLKVRAFASPAAPAGSGAYASSGAMLYGRAYWEGNAFVENGGGVGGTHFNGSIYDNSTWIGNADVRSGGYAGVVLHLGERSRWTGGLNLVAAEGASVSINVMGNSVWNGRVDVNSGVYGLFNAVVLDHSTWNGDHALRFEPAADGTVAANYSLMLHDNSSYNGDGTISGPMSSAFIYIDQQSVWNGGLDLTQARLGEYGTMSVDVRNGSRWQGFLTGPALATVTVDQSEWVVTGNTAVKELNVTNSALSFGNAGNRPAGFHTLRVAGNMNVTGNVPLGMRTNIEAHQGDLLIVQGDVNTENNAPLRVTVNNQGGANITDFSRELTIVQTEGSGAVELTNDVEVGAFLYRLKHDGNDWRLYAAGVPMEPLGPSIGPYTPVAEAALETMNAGYLLTYGEMQTLTQRLGDLRTGRESDGAWARAFGGRFDIAGRRHLPSGFDMKYSGVQIGADRKLDVPNGGGLLLGAMFGTAQSKHDYARGDGKIDSTHAGVYGTYEHPEGGYADVVIKYNHIRHDDSPIDTRGERQSASAASNGFSGSLEIGKRYLLSGQDGAAQNREGWYVEPQFQVTASRQSGTDLDYSNGLRARFDAVNSLIGRAGVQAGYELKSGDNPISLYAKVSYVREFDGDVNVRFNNIDRLERFRGNWISSGLGVNAVLDKRHSVYADLESNNGNLFNSLQLNAGYRMSF